MKIKVIYKIVLYDVIILVIWIRSGFNFFFVIILFELLFFLIKLVRLFFEKN